MNNITAYTQADSNLPLMIAFLYTLYIKVVVLFAGPPLVSNRIGAKAVKEVMMLRNTTKNICGDARGSCTWTTLRKGPAPSIVALSMSSSGTFRKPTSRKMKEAPTFIQTLTIAQAMSAVAVSCVHA